MGAIMDTSIMDTGNPKTEEAQEITPLFENDSKTPEEILLDRFNQRNKPQEVEPKKAEEPNQQEVDSDDSDDQQVEDQEETTDESPEEVDEVEETEHEDEPELNDKFQKAFDKRISRELKKLNQEYQEKVAELEQKIKEVEKPADALSEVRTTMDITRLDKLEEDAERTIDFVDDNPDGFTLNEGKDDERFIDRQELIELRKNAREALKSIKKRREVIAKRNEMDNMVYKAIPTLKDKGSQEYAAVQAVYRELPILKEHPNGLVYAMYMLEGERLLAQQPKSKAKEKQAAPVAPKLPETETSPRRKPAVQKKRSIDLSEAVKNGGDQESLIRALTQRLSN